MESEPFGYKIESKEVPKFDLVVTISRHGLKEGADGPLSKKGMQETDQYFSDFYEGNNVDKNRKRVVVSSPKERARQTAQIHEAVLEHVNKILPIDIEVEEAMSEGDIMIFINSLSPSDRKDWFKYWYNKERELPLGSPDPIEILRNFSNWLLKEISKVKGDGGNVSIDAFSHGPIMGALLIYLEDALHEGLITDINSGDKRINQEQLFDLNNGKLKVLQNMSLHINSENPEHIVVSILGKTLKVPLRVFDEITKL